MTILKFSKKYDLFEIKKDFFNNNNQNLKKIQKINNFYAKQKKRMFCKICMNKLQNFFLTSFSIEYCFCSKCGHLNGRYEDTQKFSNWLYAQSDGKNYKSVYMGDYEERVKKIYIPKVQFLKSVIKSKISVLDFGSGAGHFLKALEKFKIKSLGFETNKALVNLGKSRLKNKNLNLCNPNENIFDNSQIKNYNVLSLIHVLEHLEKPNEIIKSFKNSKFKYLYLAIPLASFSIFVENAFAKIFPRHLAAGHTHLFTKESLEYLIKKNKLNIMGEWWFGSDVSDLLRSISISSKNTNNQLYSKYFKKYILNFSDDLQNIIDKKKLCSEVHLVIRK